MTQIMSCKNEGLFHCILATCLANYRCSRASYVYRKSLAITVKMDELYRLFTLSDKAALLVWLNRSNTL